MFQTEVKVKKLLVKDLFLQYWKPEVWKDACKTCPYYGTLWSCPPDVPHTKTYLSKYESVYLIGIKVIYENEFRKKSKGKENEFRSLGYDKVKRSLLETLLVLEQTEENSLTVAAGRCELCKECTRKENKPCRFPEKKRYSFSSFGFDISQIAEIELSIPLLWSGEGLPVYDVAIAAFFTKK